MTYLKIMLAVMGKMPEPLNIKDPLPALGGVRLSFWKPSDLAVIEKACADPDIAAFTSMPAPNTVACRNWLSVQEDHRLQNRALHFALRDKTENVLGNVGLISFEWQHRRAEIGYWVLPRARGKGVASKGLNLLSAWTFNSLPITRIDLFTSLDNAGSRAVAERVGYKYEAKLDQFRIYDGQQCDLILHRLLKEEYEAAGNVI